MNNTTHCARCGRRLKDPVSMAIGLGKECRGKNKSRRQIAYVNRVARGQAYENHTPIYFSNIAYFYQDGGWVTPTSKQPISDSAFKEWLEKNNLAVSTKDYQTALISRKQAILDASQLQSLSITEVRELESELAEIEKELNEQ